jgi:hypothetical protein
MSVAVNSRGSVSGATSGTGPNSDAPKEFEGNPCCKLHRITTITNFVQLYPSLQANRHSATQEILNTLMETDDSLFAAALTRTWHWFLIWATWMKFGSSHPISLQSIWILPSHLRLHDVMASILKLVSNRFLQFSAGNSAHVAWSCLYATISQTEPSQRNQQKLVMHKSSLANICWCILWINGTTRLSRMQQERRIPLRATAPSVSFLTIKFQSRLYVEESFCYRMRVHNATKQQ